MSTWIKDVTAYYHEQLKTNPDYKFKDALKDLSRKRKGLAATPKTHHKKSKKPRKSKKSRKSKK
jgi:hypothetical protein